MDEGSAAPAAEVFNWLTAHWLLAGMAPLAVGVAVTELLGRFARVPLGAALAVGWVCGSALAVPLAGWTARSLRERVASLQARVRDHQAAAEVARAAADEARSASAAFVNTMNHELRTPLNAILGFGHLLDMSSLTADQRECLQQVLRGGRHLQSLVNDLPHVAGEAGTTLLEHEAHESCPHVR